MQRQRLTKAESLAILRDSLSDDHGGGAVALVPEPTGETRLTVAVALRRARVAGSTLLSVSLLVALTEIFRHGVVLETFDKATKTPEQRAAMLDKYNSYSGNAASALGRPVELLLAVMAQLVVLRFLAASLVRPQLSWRLTIVALTLSAVVGFLINNGFNALNVQMIDVDTRPVIAASDLSAATDADLRAVYAPRTSNVTQSIPETQPRNPITNTLLRNLVLAREPKMPPACNKSYNQNLRFPDDVVDYGFPQRDWMKQVLPEALDVNSLRIVLNATDESINKNVTRDRLPMNASRAADLFLTSVLLSYTYIPWGKKQLWLDTYNATNGTTRSDGRPMENPVTAVVAGLLPPNGSQATEAQQREWFLRKSRSFLNTREIKSQNLSRSDVVLEFAHVDLSPTITFDSVTWEVELDPGTLAEFNTTREGKSTRYKVLPSETDCGPWPAVCSVPRLESDTPVVIHAFAVCANPDGSETLMSEPRGTTMWDFFVQCPSTTNNSLLLISATKRLVADALQENMTANATGIFPANNSAVVTNLRKMYTFTVGRLGWAWQNLADKYGAECDLAAGTCEGLDFELAGGAKQRLIVGASSVPLGLLNGPYYEATFLEIDQHPVPIVKLVEPQASAPDKQRWDVLAGDYLLRHNIGNVSWDMSRRYRGQTCEVVLEDRQQLVLNNHLYMETTLQATYTAGLFYVFQNGVVKDALTLSQNQQTLQFDGNVQNIAVRISIPTDNATLTYIGCALLAGALAVALVWPSLQSRDAVDPLREISAPHVIARVMLDDRTFPSFLLHRRVVSETSDGRKKSQLVDEFLIDSIVLSHQASDASADGSGDECRCATTSAPTDDDRKGTTHCHGVAV